MNNNSNDNNDTKELLVVTNASSSYKYMALVPKNNSIYLYDIFPIDTIKRCSIAHKTSRLADDIIRKPNMTEFFNAAQILKMNKKLFNLKTKKWIQK